MHMFQLLAMPAALKLLLLALCCCFDPNAVTWMVQTWLRSRSLAKFCTCQADTQLECILKACIKAERITDANRG